MSAAIVWNGNCISLIDFREVFIKADNFEVVKEKNEIKEFR